MRKRIDWKFIKTCHSQDELDNFLDASRPTTIAKSNLTNCSLCHSNLIVAHKMRSQYLNCSSKLCGPKCESRYLVLSCEIAGKIDIYSANEHNQEQSISLENTHDGKEIVEDYLSRKCRKIIENIMMEKSIIKPELILAELQQNEVEYDLAIIPSLTQIKNYVKTKKQNIKNRLNLIPLLSGANSINTSSYKITANLHESTDLDGEKFPDDYEESEDSFANLQENISDNFEQLGQSLEVGQDKVYDLNESLGKIERDISKLEESQKRQVHFTDNYFEDIETRLKENRAKLIKEIDKGYQLFSERINYLKNKYKLDNKMDGDSSEMEEFKAKKERLISKMDNKDLDSDNLDLLVNEASYISEQLQSSLGQIEQNIANIKRIRYEPNRSLSESGSLLGDLFVDEGTNKRRRLDF